MAGIMKEPERMLGVHEDEWKRAMTNLKSSTFFTRLATEFKSHPNRVAEEKFRLTNTQYLVIDVGFGAAIAKMLPYFTFKETYGTENSSYKNPEDALKKVCDSAYKFLKNYE